MHVSRRLGRVLGLPAALTGLAIGFDGMGASRPAFGAKAAAIVTMAMGNQSADEAGFLQSINDVRATKGLAALRVDPRLLSVARGWSTQMASAATLYHNPDLVNQIPNDWTTAGENVGVGPDEPDIAQAFIKSPEHYVNIVRSTYTDVGIGVVYGSDGRLWVTEDFASYSRPASSPSPAATTAPLAPPSPTSVARPKPPTTASAGSSPPRPTVTTLPATPAQAARTSPTTTTTAPPAPNPTVPGPDIDRAVRNLDDLDASS